MSDKDAFELDVEETADEEFDDVSLDEGVDETAEKAPKKKKSGGGLVIFVLLLAVLGGGGFAAVKFLGVELPFDVPGLTQQTAQAPVARKPAQMTASADLPAGAVPPQPEAAASSFSPMSNLPESLTSAQQEEATISAPWATEETAPATVADTAAQMPDEAAMAAPGASESNIVDPFAFGQQDVTAEVNAAPASIQTQPAPEPVEIVDPFASMTAPQADPAPVAAAPAAAAPVEDVAAKAKVAELEKKLAETQKSLEASEKALTKANNDLAKKSEELAKAQADLKAAQKTAKTAESKPAATESKPAAVAKPAAVQTAKPATRPAAPVRKIEWVLRSAKPGMAWVSEKGSNEMRTVGVGDTLAGIGKVTSITTDAQGRWVVNGTRGTINQ